MGSVKDSAASQAEKERESRTERRRGKEMEENKKKKEHTPGRVFCSWRALWAFSADSLAQ